MRALFAVAMALWGPTTAMADPGPLLGEELRYPSTPLPLRILFDVAAIPANVPRWEASDWLQFAGFAGATVALMLPTGPSPDARIDRWITANLDAHVPDIWIPEMQAVLWGGLAAGSLTTWGVALLTDEPELAESMSLMVEAVAVAQLYHLSLKLALGREGPRDGEGTGRILGPAESLRLFPAGTPSGHFATLYSVLAAITVYWDAPWPALIAAHAVVGGLAVMHVVNHRHFASDVIWGGAMGYAIGAWVVRHRSTRFIEKDGGLERLTILPWQSDDGVTSWRGLALSGAF